MKQLRMGLPACGRNPQGRLCVGGGTGPGSPMGGAVSPSCLRGCPAQRGRGPGGVGAIRMAQLLAGNRAQCLSPELGGWACPEV